MRSIIYLTAVVSLLSALSAGAAEIRVDLAHPISGESFEPRPGTAKEGWTPWVAPRWSDMYMHDFVTLENIDGTGISAGISMAREGNGGLKVYDMCMENKAGGPPNGSPKGDPIANTWYYNVDWGGNPRGTVVLLLYGLPAGQYTLTSYHNFWIICSAGSRECTQCVPDMPPMPRVFAVGLPDADPDALGLYGYGKFIAAAGDALGNPAGVELIEGAYNVMYSTTLNDDEVATSEISFRTNGTAVLVIYEAPPDWTDPRGRDGGRGILNAFELVSEGGPAACACPGDLNADDQIDLDDLQAVADILLDAGSPFIVTVEEGRCGDLNTDLQVDLDDLQAVATILLDAGSPFIVLCQ